jgi:hypothetical protein
LLRNRSVPENPDNAAHADQYPHIVENRRMPRRLLLTSLAGAKVLNNYCGLRQG